MSEIAAHGLGPTGVFLGTFMPRLDDKGRLILPAKFRGRLASGLVATRGLDRCIFVFPIDEFQEVHARLRKAPLENKAARDYMRSFLAYAQDDIPDKQGRVLLSQPLRKYAGIDREVAVVGMGSRVEIWDVEAWEKYLEEGEDAYAETAAEVFDDM
ncbi:division/cell wall cluster transcriptional repressor MraZ [Demequina salsinemoris]|uniref:division/cell wall cluster transcriptional repressor MraZ n=1 Tax=Demequina salsinemoris TaxID=577470 RepID=UPI0009FBD3A4|nr:division/cell wall cluster transcriptional repressor MraZ [Demequina salsinemoris]